MRELRDSPATYCWNEDSAPISYRELETKFMNSSIQKGGTKTEMRKHLSLMNVGSHDDVGYDELQRENEKLERLSESTYCLGEKFKNDKVKLEDAIMRVQTSRINPKDKEKMLAELIAALNALQAQYEKEVTAELSRIRERKNEQLERVNQVIDELKGDSDYLRDITMDVSSVDASAAADEGDNKRREFEQMKEKYQEELRLQMEQAERQRRSILGRRTNDR